MNWHRVFGATDLCPASADLQRCLAEAGFSLRWRFFAEGDEWFRAEAIFPDGRIFALERWHSEEDGIRAELNSWAALMELGEETLLRVQLMERIIQTRQFFTIEDSPCAFVLSRYLAAQTNGFFHIDGQGFFDATGNLLFCID